MMHHKRKAASGFCAALLLAAGCSPGDTATATSAARPVASLRWQIVAEGAALERDWGAYEVLAAVSQQSGITPAIEWLAGETAAQTVVKRLQAGDCPDLLTLSVRDPLLLQLGHITCTKPIDDIPALLALVPAEVQALHRGTDGRLPYLPGGFDREGADAVLAEGVYVRREMLALLELSAPADAHALLAAAAAYSDWFARYRPDAYQGCVPVVFGLGGRGLDTLEHLYGRAPLRGEDASPAVTAFLARLADAGGSWAGMQATEATLDSLLRDQSLVYIGPCAPLERYNRQYPEEAYIPIWPVFSAAGFVEAEPRLGGYATYIGSEGARLADAVSLLTALLSEEGSRTLLYGVRDRHWALDDAGQVVLFPDIQHSVTQGGAALLARTGIGLFPYVSSLGAAYPGLRPAGMAVRDLLPETVAARIDPTTEEGLQRSRRVQERLETYRQALDGARAAE